MLVKELSETKDDILLHEEEINLWEMANLRSEFTGIDGYIIWISSGEAAKHGPRIKVSKGIRWDKNNSATIPLTGKPRIIGDLNVTQSEFSEIIKWVNLNKKILLEFWNSKLSTDQVLNLLKKV